MGLLFLHCCLVTAEHSIHAANILPLQCALLLRNDESLMLASLLALGLILSFPSTRGVCVRQSGKREEAGWKKRSSTSNSLSPGAFIREMFHMKKWTWELARTLLFFTTNQILGGREGFPERSTTLTSALPRNMGGDQIYACKCETVKFENKAMTTNVSLDSLLICNARPFVLYNSE